MVTTSDRKSRTSREEWRQVRSYEDRGEVRRAFAPKATWEVEARHFLLSQAWSDATASGSATTTRAVFDSSALEAYLRSVVARYRVPVDSRALEASEQWDWEDVDSCDRTTLEEVRDLMKRLAFIARDTFGYHLDVPHPAPAGEGSVDVFFEGAERNLLINTPNGDELVTYFGSDRSGTTLGGSLSRRKSRRDLMTLAAWIKGIQ